MELMNVKSLTSGHQIIWTNDAAREKWNPAISQIRKAVERSEIESVIRGHRKCGTITCSPRQMLDMADRHSTLVFEPLQVVKRFEGFSHRHESPGPDDDFYIYYAYSESTEAVKAFKGAYKKQDHLKIGDLLGFPPCCCRFFDAVWKNGFIDPIWQIALNSLADDAVASRPTSRFDPVEISDRAENDRTINLPVAPHPCSNPVLRYIGIRAGFHIPHSFRCKHSIESGKRRLSLIPCELRAIFNALLSMPMQWSVLHGIAEIRTPIFWIVTASVPTLHKYTVNLTGPFNTREGETWT